MNGIRFHNGLFFDSWFNYVVVWHFWDKATDCPLLTCFKPAVFGIHGTFSTTLLWFSYQPFFSLYITQLLLPYADRKTGRKEVDSKLRARAGRWASLISVGLPYADLHSVRCSRLFVCYIHTYFLFLFWHSASHHSSLLWPDKASQNTAPSRWLDTPSSTNSTHSDHSFRYRPNK